MRPNCTSSRVIYWFISQLKKYRISSRPRDNPVTLAIFYVVFGSGLALRQKIKPPKANAFSGLMSYKMVSAIQPKGKRFSNKNRWSRTCLQKFYRCVFRLNRLCRRSLIPGEMHCFFRCTPEFPV